MTEQYWATRALRAEALLVAQEAHKQEVKTLGDHQDTKRQVGPLAYCRFELGAFGFL